MSPVLELEASVVDELASLVVAVTSPVVVSPVSSAIVVLAEVVVSDVVLAEVVLAEVVLVGDTVVPSELLLVPPPSSVATVLPQPIARQASGRINRR